ncbi:uncharacterized protein BDZ83DRAFT_290200 [Colletotrichum acutatum]|uniref:Uncharacterized protein n=1 Tax=Glomerella acutata TaxID=27357 RepID=A0AAD8XPA1_GLOAC|nr:uncharacterized protein BDZ83DRAFT_290200 [Colletotrichum acutatum]KAK1730941.1 hypothetical protein BDZ83DRAFT_290200 [Colletotrichum acutatum]
MDSWGSFSPLALALASNCLLCFCFLGDFQIHAKLPDLALQSTDTLPSGTEEVKKISRDYALQKRPLADSCVKNTAVSFLPHKPRLLHITRHSHSSFLPRRASSSSRCHPAKGPWALAANWNGMALAGGCPRHWQREARLGSPRSFSPSPLLAPLLPFDRKRNGPRSQFLVGETMPPSPCRGERSPVTPEFLDFHDTE